MEARWLWDEFFMKDDEASARVPNKSREDSNNEEGSEVMMELKVLSHG